MAVFVFNHALAEEGEVFPKGGRVQNCAVMHRAVSIPASLDDLAERLIASFGEDLCGHSVSITQARPH